MTRKFIHVSTGSRSSPPNTSGVQLLQSVDGEPADMEADRTQKQECFSFLCCSLSTRSTSSRSCYQWFFFFLIKSFRQKLHNTKLYTSQITNEWLLTQDWGGLRPQQAIGYSHCGSLHGSRCLYKLPRTV